MKIKFSAPVLLMLVMLTIIVTNNQFITRIKASLTLTELTLADVKLEETFSIMPYVPDLILPKFSDTGDKLPLQLSIYIGNKITNPTLNLLYLAHSPPLLA